MEYLPQTIHNRSFKRLRHTHSDEHPVAAAWRDQGHIAKFLTLQEPAEALQRKNSSCRTCQKIRKYICSILFNHVQSYFKMFKTDELECCFLLLCIYICRYDIYIYIIVLIIWTLRNSKRQRCFPEIMGSHGVRLAAGNVHPPWAWDPGPWWQRLWMRRWSQKCGWSCDQIWSRLVKPYEHCDKILFWISFLGLL